MGEGEQEQPREPLRLGAVFVNQWGRIFIEGISEELPQEPDIIPAWAKTLHRIEL